MLPAYVLIWQSKSFFDELTSLNPSILSNLILLGDFNIIFFSTSSSKTKLDVISDTFDLTQIVNAPTHFSHADTTSTIDLVFLPSNIDAPSCSILPPVSSSDHFSVLFSRPTDSVNSSSPCPPRKVWLYHLADFEHANALLCSIDWKNCSPCQILMLPRPCLKNFLSALYPPLFLANLWYPLTNSSLPWINHSFLNHVKIRNSIFFLTKRIGFSSLWTKYCSYHNKTRAYLRQLKAKFIIYLLLPHHGLFGLLLNVFTPNLSLFPPLAIMVLQ